MHYMYMHIYSCSIKGCADFCCMKQLQGRVGNQNTAYDVSTSLVLYMYYIYSFSIKSFSTTLFKQFV